MKKNIFLAVAIVGLLAGSPLLTAWTGPTASPANANITAPVNIGQDEQVKDGDLGVEDFVADSILSTGIVSAMDQVHSPEYCNASGTDCFNPTNVALGAPTRTVRTATGIPVNGDEIVVSCVGSEILVGGGCRISNTYDEDSGEGDLFSYPDGNRWACESARLLTPQVEATAICLSF
jgi:hypothetical protein